jgi:hypothetical protein
MLRAGPNADTLALLAERQKLDPGGFQRATDRFKRA